MQETQFLISLLENGISSKQTALQLLAAEHLYVPTLLPKLKKYEKTLKKVESLEKAFEKGAFDDYCFFNPGSEECREYDV